MVVFGVIGTVFTAVDAVVGQIQRREHDDAVAVKFLFDFAGKRINLLVFVIQLTVEQDERFFVRDALHLGGFFENLFDDRTVVFVFFCVGKTGANFFIADKFLSLWRHDIVHSNFPLLQLGINGFCRHTVQHTDFSGHRTDNRSRCINSDADKRDVALFIRQTHSADDVVSILVQNLVELIDVFRIFYNDSENRNAGFFHNTFLLIKKTSLRVCAGMQRACCSHPSFP